MKGITVTLTQLIENGVDAFNCPVYTETTVAVDDVLVSPLTDDEVVETLNLTGKKAKYQLGIPKGDTHDWTNTFVEFFGERFRTIGHPVKGIDDLIPLRWNMKVKVESIADES